MNESAIIYNDKINLTHLEKLSCLFINVVIDSSLYVGSPFR